MQFRNNTSFQPHGGHRLPAGTLVPGPGHGRVGIGTAFKKPTARRRGVLVLVWGDDQPVLEGAIGPFYPAFGLGTVGQYRGHSQFLQRSTPLG